MVLRVIVTVLLIAASARAQPVVLVGDDAGFASALDDALVPAGMDVVAVAGVAPPPSAELPARSRELAERQHATATVWLLPAPGGATLVAYDRTVDRLLVRELPYRSPLSATQAADAARMVRTMLRALRVPDDVAPPPPAVPASPDESPPPARTPLLAASAGIAGWFLAPGNDSTLAASLALAWRPHALGIALTGLVAPATDLVTMTFAGHVRDVAVAAEVRLPVVVAPDVRVMPALGLAVHALSLAGTFGSGELTSRRYNPAVRLGITAAYALPRNLDLALTVSADGLLRRQKYEAATEQILVVPRLQLAAGMMIGVLL